MGYRAVARSVTLAIHFVYYNFIRIHTTLKVSPAMAAGIATTLWSWKDIIKRMDAMAPPPTPRGHYRSRQPTQP